YYEGVSLIAEMKKGDSLKLINDYENEHDYYAVRIKYKNKMVGYVPRSDNRHLYRMLKQELNLHCEILEVHPHEDAWHMCKVKVELIG
ncbi:MAG: HIRAN domain-containing protein, partial [Candidatus Marinimicrobia bacterium]|nr:HIRAN domain-containing protein [Candidatus Neomarinimicrobiota bacterium]